MVRFSHRQTKVDSLDQLLQETDAMLEELQFNLVKAQQRMKYYADKFRKELTIEEGELVFLTLRPYKQRSLASRMNDKLAWRYYGPYKVVKKIREVAYKLELPSSFFYASRVPCLAAQKSPWGCFTV